VQIVTPVLDTGSGVPTSIYLLLMALKVNCHRLHKWCPETEALAKTVTPRPCSSSSLAVDLSANLVRIIFEEKA
jgi:hypothetical protein